MQFVHKLKRPAVYFEEVHLIDFEKLTRAINPSYFGVVRDPYARFRSRWQYTRNPK